MQRLQLFLLSEYIHVGKLCISHIMVLHRNTECITFTLVHLLTMFDAVLGYDSKCPLAFQWNVRSKFLCIVELHYTCLYDDVKGNTIESCNGPLPFIAKGYTWVIRGNPDRDKCSQGTYQPYKHRNLKSSDCVYKKSICSEEGQVIHDTGNNTDDHTCRCDYRRGYDFVVKHRNQCYCYPSKEDCSCYIRQCDNTDTSLSQDYQCKETFNTTTVCSMIKEDLENEFKPDLYTRFRQKDADLYWLPVVITILIVFPTALPLIVLVFIQIHKCIHQPVFEESLNDTDCTEGDKKGVLQCRESGKNDEASLSTDSEIPLSKASITKKGYIHRDAIKTVKQNHCGNYTETVRGQSCTALLTVKVSDIFSSYLKSQTCFFGEDVQFECKLAVGEMSSNWFKDTNDYELSCNWETTSTLRKHALKIKAVTFEDEGRYSIYVRNVISSAKLVVRDELLIKTEDIHYLLSVYILSNIATPAIRDVFDKEFNPHTLRETLQINKGTLLKLKQQKDINLEEWKLLFDHHKGSAINSAQFDIRLMVLLLRNITRLDIVNSLPNPTNTSKDADLSRIHFYRNSIAHNHGKMSNDDLVQSVKDLMEA